MMVNRNNTDNFDPKAEIQRLKDDFGSILSQPDKFAEVFCKAAKSQKIIDEELRTIIIKLIQTDQIVRDSIKCLIKEYESQERSIMKKTYISWIEKIAIIVISGAVGYWLKK